MIDIDRQIEIARKKPLNAENLNYIGDLYLKKDDKQQALAYFYEAADKLHFGVVWQSTQPDLDGRRRDYPGGGPARAGYRRATLPSWRLVRAASTSPSP